LLQLEQVLNRISQVVQHTYVMGNIRHQKLGSVLMVFDIPFEHLRIHVIESTTNDGFTRFSRRASTAVTFRANLQRPIVCTTSKHPGHACPSIKPLVHEQDSSIGDNLGLAALAHPGGITESPAATVDRKALPIQQVVGFS
jgi:hypothetical protein